jgi:cell division cycle 20, cofactor of APC complex
VRLWDIDPTSSYQASFSPEKFEPNAQVTSLHFSPHCKELLSTHGPGSNSDSSTNEPAATTTPENTQNTQNIQNISAGSNSSKGMANSIAVHAVPSLRHVMTVSVASFKGLSGSVINANATKAVLVVPEENKLKVWEVWGKAKEGRRHSSFMDKSTIR